MNWSFDTSADALYVGFTNGPIESQVEMPDGVVVDVAADGRAVGIEVIHPAAGWDVQAVIDRFPLDSKQVESLVTLLHAFLFTSVMSASAGRAEMPQRADDRVFA